MKVVPIIDAHALLWFLGGSPRLGAQAKLLLQTTTDEIVLPSIALAEAHWITEKRRVALTPAELTAALDADQRINVYPLDRTVVERSLNLTSIYEMHDRLIVATALVLQDQGNAVQLLTLDENITDFGGVPIIWSPSLDPGAPLVFHRSVMRSRRPFERRNEHANRFGSPSSVLRPVPVGLRRGR